jgi:hypothetical protein
MSWLPFLNSIENTLNNLSKPQTFQLYAIIILLFLAFIYHFTHIENFFERPLNNKVVLKQNGVNTFDFMNDLEPFLQQHQLTLTQFQEQNGLNYVLQATGSLSSLLFLVNFIEHYKSVNNLKTIKLQHHFHASTNSLLLEFSFEKFLYDTTAYKNIHHKIANLKTKAVPHPKIKTSKPMTTTDAIKIFAIVNKSVLIYNRWYKELEQVNNFTITKIRPKEVVFLNDSKREITIKLRP